MLNVQMKLLAFLVLMLSISSSGFADQPLGQTAELMRPNIVLIYTDDQGLGDVSCLNPDSKFMTPHLDRLAKEGMIFTDAHCSDTVCSPSRYGLLTGRYSWRTELKRGVLGSETPCLIDSDRMTLASLCSQQGYTTAMVGKWHLGMQFPGDRNSRDWTQPVTDMPLDKGFDYFFGIPASLNYGILAWFEGRYARNPPIMYTQKKPNAVALDDYRIRPPYEKKPRVLGGTSQWGMVQGQLEIASDFVDSQCLTKFTDQAIDWLKNHCGKQAEAKPFFLYLPFTSPHKPVIPIEPFLGKSDAGAYGDFMMETDWHVGRVLETLDGLGVSEQTMVIFSSDNGPETTWKKRAKTFNHQSNLGYREGKRSIYEGGHRVPFFIRWPKIIQPGGVSDRPICQTDIMATVAEILDVDLPDDAGEDSVSFLAELLVATRQESSAIRLEPIVHHSSGGGFAIREGRWKLIMQHRRQKMELYDLQADPFEKNDLREQHPAIVKQMTTKLTEVVQRGRTTEGAVQANDVDWWEDLTWIPNAGQGNR